MKAVFMTGDEKNLAGVYKTVREKLTAELDFISPITSAAQLEERKEELRDVGVIFSTWGMLSLDEETIRKYFVNLRAIFDAAGSVQYFARPFLSRGVRVSRRGRRTRCRSSSSPLPRLSSRTRDIIKGSGGTPTRNGRTARQADTSQGTSETRSGSSVSE